MVLDARRQETGWRCKWTVSFNSEGLPEFGGSCKTDGFELYQTVGEQVRGVSGPVCVRLAQTVAAADS